MELISKSECDLLLDWIYQNKGLFKPNLKGLNRKYYVFSKRPYVPKLLYEIKNRIIEKENITHWHPEPVYEDYIGWISDGGFIHEHKDENLHGFKHVRYNLFLSVPEKGGDPIYNGKRMEFSERSYIKCNSGNELHSCEPVIGKKPRIVVSYGFLTS